MKKLYLSMIAALVTVVFCGWMATAQSPVKDPSKIVQANGTIVINTKTLCPDVEGFMGPTPVEIRIRKDTIIDIIALPNDESPSYFYDATAIFKKWIGLTPKKGLELKVDAVSGATFSSKALIENMRAGLKRALED
ncbi:MAG: FMN-binding protein [Bacteroidales bacterium]|nr:FMN-binding protein [Bacteroidales bacterium]